MKILQILLHKPPHSKVFISFLCFSFIMYITLNNSCAQSSHKPNINLRDINKSIEKEIRGKMNFNDKSYDRSIIFEPMISTPNRLFSANLSRPEIFSSSNNLAKKAGSFYRAKGEVIRLTGKVTDSFGVPISGAIIKIWQTNAAGKYQNLLIKNSDLIDVNFSMSGTATTDNLGNYNFLTIMPGTYLNRAPHINIDISHKQFGDISTEIYFEDHPKNKLDYQYLSYNKVDQNLLTAKVKLSNIFQQESQKICSFSIVMPGVHKYKNFRNK